MPWGRLPVIPKMTSHREDGLTPLKQVDSMSQWYPAILVPSRYRVLPSALREDLKMVTMMTGHCNNRLTLLRKVDSTLQEDNLSKASLASLPPDLASLTGGPPFLLYLSIQRVLRKLSPQFSSLIVGLVTCCPTFEPWPSKGRESLPVKLSLRLS